MIVLSNVFKLKTSLVWEERIKSLSFSKKKLVIVDEEQIVREFIFIVIGGKNRKKFKVTGYSKYFFKELTNSRIETIEFHAKIIISFLNYIFFDEGNKSKIKSIAQLTVDHGNEFLKEYGTGRLGGKTKTKVTVEKAEQILNRFYMFLVKECKDLKYISPSDFRINNTTNLSKKWNQNRNSVAYRSVFTVLYPDRTPPRRIKYISGYVLSELIATAGDMYPHLKLAICLQAFGGLRRGEVCNVTKDKIRYSLVGKELGWFMVNLKEITQIRSDLLSTGEIKRRRIQPIHPVFLSYFKKIYDEHLKLIQDIENPYGALFLNNRMEAMTANSYEQKFKNIIKVLIERLVNSGNPSLLSEANVLMSGRVNTHVLRHYFTQFISELETTRLPTEIAYWRGDVSLDSAIVYLTQNPAIDEKIKEIQRNIYNEFVL